jgi:hypothetical protein
MGPFDLPPSTPPVSFDPPPQNSPRRRSTGRTAAVAAACVALIAAGVLAVAQFASSNKVDVANAAQEGGTTPPTPPTAPEPSTPSSTAPTDSEVPDEQAPDDTTDLDGKIVIQIGDGDPIVIDLGDLGSLAGGNGNLGDLGKIEQCIGDLPFDLNIDGGPGLNVFGSGGQITVTGPNGLTVLDFGEGDGSVTITKKDGEITISSEGDVQENDLTAPDASTPPPSLPDLPNFDEIYQCLEDATG